MDETRNAGPPALSRADWVDKALDLLVREGVDGVRITRLAARLGVTRGSFYWHFRDRGDLLDALVARWQDKNTAAIVSAVASLDDLTLGIIALFSVWLEIERFDPRLDAAMRDWARRSDGIRQAVADADRARVEAIGGLFERAGYPHVEAFIRARIIYFTQVGYYALGLEETLVQRFGYLEAYFEGFTGRRLDPAVAAAYRALYLGDRQAG